MLRLYANEKQRYCLFDGKKVYAKIVQKTQRHRIIQLHQRKFINMIDQEIDKIMRSLRTIATITESETEHPLQIVEYNSARILIKEIHQCVIRHISRVGGATINM